ncbi:MAG: NfeD family protein [Ardenticatenaceae bacterium]|nr:NfeD family protein [Ardenticatenaceae bacterium]MCB9445342.1 NfeD family protein [Ardenticatenaceae bacterium]
MHHLLLLLPLLALVLFFILPWPLALLIYLPILGVSLWAYWKAWQALQRPPEAGEESMIGHQAVVLNVKPNNIEVHIGGERWLAHSSQPVRIGQKVIVEAVDGLTLLVRPLPTVDNQP